MTTVTGKAVQSKPCPKCKGRLVKVLVCKRRNFSKWICRQCRQRFAENAV